MPKGNRQARRREKRSAARGGRTATPRRESVADVFQRVRRATVALGIIQAKKFPLTILGTGVAVEETGVIATAGHVLDKLDEVVEQLTRQGRDAVARVAIFRQTDTSFDPQATPDHMRLEVGTLMDLVPIVIRARNESDVAIVKVDAKAPIPALPIDYARNYREGELLATCGFPYGLEVHEGKAILSSFLTGIISAVVPHPAVPVKARLHYLLQMPANPGNSGGPVFDSATGNLLGVISRRHQVGDIPTGTCIAEPIHRAQKAIKTMRDHPIAVDPSQPQTDSPRLSQEASQT